MDVMACTAAGTQSDEDYGIGTREAVQAMMNMANTAAASTSGASTPYCPVAFKEGFVRAAYRPKAWSSNTSA